MDGSTARGRRFHRNVIFKNVKVRQDTRWKIWKLATRLGLPISDCVDELVSTRMEAEGIDLYASVLDPEALQRGP